MCECYGSYCPDKFNTWSSLNHTDSAFVAAASQHIPTILKLSSRIPTVKAIVSMEKLSDEARKIYEAWGGEVGIKIFDIPQGTREISLSKKFI